MTVHHHVISSLLFLADTFSVSFPPTTRPMLASSPPSALLHRVQARRPLVDAATVFLVHSLPLRSFLLLPFPLPFPLPLLPPPLR